MNLEHYVGVQVVCWIVVAENDSFAGWSDSRKKHHYTATIFHL